MRKIFKQYITPVTDILIKDDKVYVYIELPCVHKEDIELKIEESTFLLRAEMKLNFELDERISVMEYSVDIFVLELELSENIDTSNIKTKFERGVLTLIFKCLEDSEAVSKL